MCSSADILQGLNEAGVIIASISAVQRKALTKTWVLTFKSPEMKELVLGIERFSVCGCPVHLSDVASSYVIVKIYKAPPEMPDTVVIGRLSAYGEVISFRRDCASAGIENGICTARMNIRRDIPSSVRIVGEAIRVWYADQPLTCRRCGGKDHVAGGCNNFRCFNCEGPGHRAHQCPEPPLFGVCLEAGDRAVDCPVITFSGNVEEKGTPVPYARAVGEAVRPATAQTKVKPPQKQPQKPRDEDQRKREEPSSRGRHDGSPKGRRRPPAHLSSSESEEDERRDRREKRRDRQDSEDSDSKKERRRGRR